MKKDDDSFNLPLNIAREDLKHCLELLDPELWQSLAGKRIFITGGTGFVGKWLMATLLYADEALNLNCQVTILSRDPSRFQQKWPETSARINWIAGDVRDFDIDKKKFDVIIHAATDVVDQGSQCDILSTCIDGTRRVMSLARNCGANSMLLVSSGAVYGPFPAGMTHVPETYIGGPDPLSGESAYGEGKRVSEWLAVNSGGSNLEVKIARIFALVGPHLPLDKQFAIGNFIRAAITNQEIVINGDGTPRRSYLYAADMAGWLWTILLKGESKRAYNVGSDESVSILELANRVCNALKQEKNIHICKRPVAGNIVSHYVPDISRSIRELGIELKTTLDEAIIRTAIDRKNLQS